MRLKNKCYNIFGHKILNTILNTKKNAKFAVVLMYNKKYKRDWIRLHAGYKYIILREEKINTFIEPIYS